LLGDAPTGPGGGEGGGFRKQGQGPDPEETLDESRRPLYRDLKRWRNEQSKTEGKPAYAIARNAQLAEIARRLPRALAELREIDGIGEAFCRDYGAKVLDDSRPARARARSPAEDDAEHDGGSSTRVRGQGPVGTKAFL
jgi:superfamily II DNA helicase RecQ